MKLAIYYPDNWSDLAIDLRVSLPKGSDVGHVWFEVKTPREHYPGDVTARLEDDGED